MYWFATWDGVRANTFRVWIRTLHFILYTVLCNHTQVCSMGSPSLFDLHYYYSTRGGGGRWVEGGKNEIVGEGYFHGNVKLMWNHPRKLLPKCKPNGRCWSQFTHAWLTFITREKQFHLPKGKLVRHLFLTDEGKKKIKQIHFERVLCLTVQWYMQWICGPGREAHLNAFLSLGVWKELPCSKGGSHTSWRKFFLTIKLELALTRDLKFPHFD